MCSWTVDVLLVAGMVSSVGPCGRADECGVVEHEHDVRQSCSALHAPIVENREALKVE